MNNRRNVLRRYSIQSCIRLKKYHKNIALGLYDVGLVNIYILHCESMKRVDHQRLAHSKFWRFLSAQLCTDRDLDLMDDDVPAGTTPRHWPLFKCIHRSFVQVTYHGWFCTISSLACRIWDNWVPWMWVETSCTYMYRLLLAAQTEKLLRANVATKLCERCSSKAPTKKRVYLCTERRPQLTTTHVIQYGTIFGGAKCLQLMA